MTRSQHRHQPENLLPLVFGDVPGTEVEFFGLVGHGSFQCSVLGSWFSPLGLGAFPGLVFGRSGKVRLVGRTELPGNWDPATDKRLTVWEIVQHLIGTLEQEGESAAAALVHKVGGIAETARDLAYRLYSICERKKWADEALAYNGLVIAWPELTKLALAERSKTKDTQREMF